MVVVYVILLFSKCLQVLFLRNLETCFCLILCLDDWAGRVYATLIMVTYWQSMSACCCLWHWNNGLTCRCPWEENVMNGLLPALFFFLVANWITVPYFISPTVIKLLIFTVMDGSNLSHTVLLSAWCMSGWTAGGDVSIKVWYECQSFS